MIVGSYLIMCMLLQSVHLVCDILSFHFGNSIRRLTTDSLEHSRVVISWPPGAVTSSGYPKHLFFFLNNMDSKSINVPVCENLEITDCPRLKQ